MGGEERRGVLIGVQVSLKIQDRRFFDRRGGPRRSLSGPRGARAIRPARAIVPAILVTAGALVRTRSAVDRRLGASAPRMRAALWLLVQEFELFRRDPRSVLRMLPDGRFPA